MPTRANRDTNSYGMKVGNGAQAPHTEIEDRICLNIFSKSLFFRYLRVHVPQVYKPHLCTTVVRCDRW